MTRPNHLVAPHGGALVDLRVDAARATELHECSRDWPSWDLTPRQSCDLELLVSGGFSPLRGFMVRADHERVMREMRLADGTLWPIPVVLDVSEAFAAELETGARIALRDPEGVMVAGMTVEERWTPDRREEAGRVFGTTDQDHPGVARLLESARPVYVGGPVEALRLPSHYDFRALRRTPHEVRAEFARLGWTRIAGFQTRNPMHRAHVELTLRAARETETNLLIHPVVGQTMPGDIDHFARVRSYQAILDRYPRFTATLSLLPLAMRMAGPREALWHGIIRKNFGCTHFIVGRDHAGPGSGSDGNGFYGPYDAQDLVREHEAELGVTMIPFRQMVYVEDRAAFLPADEVPEGSRTLHISGTELRERLRRGREIPEWFTYPEVTAELRRGHPPIHRQGFTVFFTGLSGAGKSAVAHALLVKLQEMGGRPVTLLDGDIVRKNLSSELGFSKEHRDLNIRRIGFVASEITKNSGIAICAPIAPYADARDEVRENIEQVGGFVLVFVDTPLEVCEQRDRKGLYAKARAGIIENFTGISDAYEAPRNADVVLTTTDSTPDEEANRVILHLEKMGFIAPDRG